MISEEMIEALRVATRVNKPDGSGERLVGWRLPEALAWPQDGSAFDILQTILDLLPSQASPIEVMRGALRRAEKAIASLPEDALGMVMVPATGEGGNGYAYPIRDELLSEIRSALGASKK